MKKLSKIKNIVCALGIVTLGVSCTDNYKEWNTNPSEVPEEMLTGLMKIGNFFPTMQLDVIPTSDVDANEYQRAQNLCGDMHSGYMTPIGTWGNSSACSYNLRYDKWNDVAFDVAFTKVMPAWKQIRDNGQEKVPRSVCCSTNSESNDYASCDGYIRTSAIFTIWTWRFGNSI